MEAGLRLDSVVGGESRRGQGHERAQPVGDTGDQIALFVDRHEHVEAVSRQNPFEEAPEPVRIGAQRRAAVAARDPAREPPEADRRRVAIGDRVARQRQGVDRFAGGGAAVFGQEHAYIGPCGSLRTIVPPTGPDPSGPPLQDPIIRSDERTLTHLKPAVPWPGYRRHRSPSRRDGVGCRVSDTPVH